MTPPAAELGAAQDVAAADDDGQLHAAPDDALGLAGDVERLVDADAALAGVAEALAAELEDDALVFGLQGIGLPLRIHEIPLCRAALPPGDYRSKGRGSPSGCRSARYQIRC